MQAKKRYVLVLLCCAFLALGYLGSSRLRTRQHGRPSGTRTRSYLDSAAAGFPDEDLVVSPKARRRAGSVRGGANCTLHACFDASRCARDFRVYVYPDDPPLSPTYRKILAALRASPHATPDPARACLFVLGADTLDRDPLSPDFVPDMQGRIDRAPHWNNGRNHVIFNLYSGSWPDYEETGMGFELGQAMLAKASMSTGHFRPGFDVSLPLFSRAHPERGAGEGATHADLSPGANKKYLLVFKGKRYLYGIGSETRNSLYHLHNGKDIILLTTCKHGKKWKEMKDPRCELENKEYDRFDYQVLLSNATFCLVPRGRRLGSFRFLEALQAGCVPVLLSNGWELPFGEAIDWRKAVVFADERLLLQVPDIVRSISPTRVHAFRQQTQVLWDNYFSSVEKIVSTTLEIIRERLYVTAQRSSFVWNSHPGALPILPQFSDVLRDFPFYLNALGAEPGPKFTAVVYVSMAASSAHSTSSPLLRLVKTVAKSAYAARIVVIWNSESVPASSVKWPPSTIPINVIQAQHKLPVLSPPPHPDRCGPQPGRRRTTHHGRGGLCVPRVAEFPRENRGVPGPLALLGRRPGVLGVHLQVDQRLLHRPHRRSLLPQILPLPLHPLPEPPAAQDRRPVPELRGHPAELPGEPRDPPAPHQGDAAQAVQGDHDLRGRPELPESLERPGPLHAAPELHQLLRQGLRVHAARPLQHPTRPRPLQGPSLEPQKEVQAHGDHWQLGADPLLFIGTQSFFGNIRWYRFLAWHWLLPTHAFPPMISRVMPCLVRMDIRKLLELEYLLLIPATGLVVEHQIREARFC